jgi:HD-GYP domain-containing protein (c-di-GMP phosphodiesterase class II)
MSENQLENSTALEYVDISLMILKRFSGRLVFDIYIKRSDTHYTKVFKKGDTVCWDRVEGYRVKGLRHFCLLQGDYEKYAIMVKYLGRTIAQSSNKFSAQETVVVLKETVSSTIQDIIDTGEINEQMVDSAANIVTVCVDNLSRDTDVLFRLIKAMGDKGYLQKHSISTSIFSILLAKASGINSAALLQKIALGGFLHDIGISQLSFRPYEKESLTDEETEEMERHPIFGKEMLDGMKGISNDVLEIVLQHHETSDGSGFPNGIRQSFPPAQIVALANTFSQLSLKHPGYAPRKPKEIFAQLRDHNERYSESLLDHFEALILPKRNRSD